MDKTVISILREIDSQIPNPYTPGVYYDVIFPNGKKAQARRTKPGYLSIRKWIRTIVKSPDGKILVGQGRMEWAYYRCNINTGNIGGYDEKE